MNTFRQEAVVFALGLALFAVYLPFAVWLHRDVLLPDRPTGQQVELISRFEVNPDGGYQARVYGNALHKRAMLYEGSKPLQEVQIAALPPLPSLRRYIRMTPGDGSDPRNNGRYYYLVQP